MKSTLDEWWKAWAPYWEQVEDRHLSVFVSEQFVEGVESPTLVVGAGQGLIVEHLRQRGLDVLGIDQCLEMSQEARRRRGLDIVGADVARLPFRDEHFATVIVSTGVVDYSVDAEDITAILEESFRVMKRGGTLFVAFYQMPRAIEETLRRIGVIQNQEYRMSRLFELRPGSMNPLYPIRGARKIARWTGRHFLPTLASFIKLGLTLPHEIRTLNQEVDALLQRAAGDGASLGALRKVVPDRVPYRREREVRELFERAGFPCSHIDQHDDCLVARCQRLTRRRARPRTYGRSGARESASWIVRTEEISKRYSGATKKAVDSLSVLIERGTIFGILGPNGAGKTTTLSMLCGLLRPDSGRINFFEDFRGRELKRHIGYVPQELAIYPTLTAKENMDFFGGIYGVHGRKLESSIEELLDMVGLLDRRDSLVETFSTGMQRRLNLAIGLIHDPQLILLDEPTVGIDPQSRNCIFEAVLELRRKGVTILYTTHYMEEASRLCDRIVIMDEGKIILEGNPREVVVEYGRIRIDFSVEPVGAGLERMTAFEAALWDADFVEECTLDEGVLMIGIDSGRDSMDAVHRIVELGESLGMELALTSVVEPSLETLFLEITGKSLRDGAA